MNLKSHLIILSATALLVSITSQSSLAFSITMPASQPSCSGFQPVWCPSMSYTFSNIGTVTVRTNPIGSLPLGGTAQFYNFLSKSSVWALNGWKFVKATKALQGSFRISLYNAVVSHAGPNDFSLPSTEGGAIETFKGLYFPGAGPFVGSFISMSYKPVGTDPTSQIHWVQLFTSNNEVISYVDRPNEGRGYPYYQTAIDVPVEQTNPSYRDPYKPGKQTFNPYYDTYFTANSTQFLDCARVSSYWTPNLFNFQTYLVQQTAPKTVTIYNGISWGYSNTYTPAKPSSGGSGGCNGNSGGGGCNKKYSGILADEIVDREPPLLDSNDPNGIEDQELLYSDTGSLFEGAEAVPEPTTVLGGLALGSWWGMVKLKRKKNKQQ